MSLALPLLQRLRDETREVHESLESQLPLNSATLTLEQYREVLEGFYMFYEPFETEILPRLPEAWSTLFESRHKLQALINDLAFVGSVNAHLNRCPTFPAYADLPQILGALYVVEGSTLGGQLITRHVRQVLGLSENEGLQFFSSYGDEVGSKWRSFRELLQQYSSPGWDDEIVSGARKTFETLQQCLPVTREATR